MEGAVRSGYQAAEQITLDLGLPRRLVQPELQRSWLARLLLGGPQSSPRSVSVAHAAADQRAS
jgi:hypothetical protein